MKYLSKQYRLVERTQKLDIPLASTLAIKFYIQKLMEKSISKYLTPSSRILEVGVGGSLTIHFLEKKGHICHGIDIEQEFIDYSSVLKSIFSSKVYLQKADAFKLPYSDNHFDYVYSVGVIEHFKKICN